MIARVDSRRFRLALRLPAMIVLSLLFLAGLLSVPGSALAKSASYQQFDVDLTVLDDGTFHIEETQTVRFVDGPFVGGHRSIPLVRIEGVENVQVYQIVDGNRVPFTQSNDPFANTFDVKTSSTEVDITWEFMPIDDGIATFVVAYDLVGALRSYPELDPPNQQVWYTPIGGTLTDETPVDAGTYTIHLPEAADPNRVVLSVDDEQITDLSAITSDYQTFSFTHGPFDGGQGWEIRLETDVVAPGAEVPAWQAADDAQRQQQQEQADRNTRIAGFAAIAGLALFFFGGVGILILWYTRGRDPHPGAVASFLPQPPDDTPPAVVGVLIDEKVNDRDIVSTFTDHGRRGIVSIQNPQSPQATIELLQVPENLTEFEKRLLRSVFPGAERGERTVPMASARLAIGNNRAALQHDLYQEVEKRGYFRKSPEATRNWWRNWATAITSLSIIAGILGSMLYSPWLLIPAFTVTILSIVLRLVARVLPKRTEKGAEEVAKWQAFERYLRDLEKYDTLDSAKANFEQFLPYAIAFGLETQWVDRFMSSTMPAPTWVNTTGDIGDVIGRPTRRGGWDGPVIITSPGGGQLWGGSGDKGGGGGGGIGLPDLDMPDLQKTSESAARGIGGASKGAVDVLNVIGAIFEIASIFTGGGGRGGSSGGGGGGFH